MAKGRGRPRKKGARWPGGKLKRHADAGYSSATFGKITAADTLTRLRETATVAAQPHRRDAAHSRHPWLGSAIGRLLVQIESGEPARARGLYDAADRYRTAYRAWWRARGVPALFREPLADGPAEAPVADDERDERVRALGARIAGMRLALHAADPVGFCALQDAILFEVDVLPALHDAALRALARLDALLSAPRRAAAA